MPIQIQQLIFGGITAFSSILFLSLARDKPPTPPCPPGEDARSVMFDGLKHALTVKDFWLLIFVAFVALAIFNGVSSLVEDIILPRGFTITDAGTLGALIVVGSILGSVVLSYFSDKQRKRRRYLFLGILLAIPGMLGLAYATNYWLLMISGFWMGFFLVGIAPIGFQYGAEIVHPTPEGTSNGLIQLFRSNVHRLLLSYGGDEKFQWFIYIIAFACNRVVMISLLVITQMKDPVFSKN